MKLRDILSEKEIEEYHKEWVLFDDKHILETEYHTHSGKPVISKVFQFKDKPIFRAGIPSKKRLRKIDPYFISEEYILPSWHLQHYFIVGEQMYHASMRLIRDTDKFRTLEVPQEIKLSSPIFWHDTTSVELIWQPKRQTKNYLVEDCFVAFYNDKNNKVKGRISARTFVEKRPYVTSIEKIKQENKKEIENLIKMIESRTFSQTKLAKPRKNLPDKNYLIKQLKKGKIPEEEIHDFFSFWDKEK